MLIYDNKLENNEGDLNCQNKTTIYNVRNYKDYQLERLWR